jgi:hypothetical protein
MKRDQQRNCFMRGILNKLSGTHITIIALAALSVPGGLGAAVVSQAVSIVDATSGVKAFVDAGRRLFVYDPIAGLANHPANIVNIVQSASSDNNIYPVYTPPAGKALIIRSAQFSYYLNEAQNSLWLYLANQIGANKINFQASEKSGSLESVFEPGVVLQNGERLTLRFGSSNGGAKFGMLTLQGYLVPTSAIPATASLEATQQFVQAGPSLKQGVQP